MQTVIGRHLANARHKGFSLLGQWEATSWPFIALQRSISPWPLPATTPETDIVIDGFPRSANTFSVQWFVYANGPGHRIAHHVHSPIQFKRAARFGIPAILLLRNPRDAVTSRVIRDPNIRIEQALLDYARMYWPLRAHLGSVVVARFEDVVNGLDPAIDAVNDRWGTTFATVGAEGAPKARTWIEQKIAWWHDFHDGGDPLRIPAPAVERQSHQDKVRGKVDSFTGKRPMLRAEEAYQFLLEGMDA